MSNWNKIFKPIVVLCVICVIITGALAATNSVTEPIITEATLAAQEAARKELLPEADTFTPVNISMDDIPAEYRNNTNVGSFTDVYRADNGAGIVITCTGKGYDGNITVMVAFADGVIKQIKVTDHSETPGKGTLVASEPTDYWNQFMGMAPVVMIPWQDGVDVVSGVTISCRGITRAVNAAIAAYNAIA